MTRLHRKPKHQTARSIQRAWSAAGVVGVAVLALGWYAIGLRPVSQLLDAKQAEVDQTYQYLETGKQLLQTLDGEKARRDQLAKRRDLVRERVAAAADEIGFLEWLTKAARAEGLTLIDYRPAGFVQYGDYDGRALQLSGSGTYQAVCRVLDGLRTCPQMNRVTDLSIVPANPNRTSYQVLLKAELLSLPASAKLSQATHGR